MVPADSDRIPRAPPYSGASLGQSILPVRDCHPLRSLFPQRSGSFSISLALLLQPRHVRKRTGLGSAPFARHYSGYRLFFLFLRVLRCFSSPGSPQLLLVTGLQPAGLPHSEMRGSIPVCRSPRLIAAYHVLPRLQKPRHPPFALVTFLFVNLVNSLRYFAVTKLDSFLFYSFAYEIAVTFATRKNSNLL